MVAGFTDLTAPSRPKFRRGERAQHDGVEGSSARHDLVINFLVIFGTILILFELLTCEDCDSYIIHAVSCNSRKC